MTTTKVLEQPESSLRLLLLQAGEAFQRDSYVDRRLWMGIRKSGTTKRINESLAKNKQKKIYTHFQGLVFIGHSPWSHFKMERFAFWGGGQECAWQSGMCPIVCN